MLKAILDIFPFFALGIAIASLIYSLVGGAGIVLPIGAMITGLVALLIVIGRIGR